MADFDRYMAACEDRDADRRLSDEEQREDECRAQLSSPGRTSFSTGSRPVTSDTP